jgi:hypothetical protein
MYYLLLEKNFKLYNEYERAYLNKLISMKDDKIDRLENKLDQQSADIEKLLNYSNNIIKQNNDLIERTDHLQITADSTQEDLDKSLIYQKEILKHLVDKSYKSTMNPDNPEQVTNFTVLKPKNITDRTILVRGQFKHVNAVIKSKSETHKAIIKSKYNANAVNLAINAQQEYITRRNDYVEDFNEKVGERNKVLYNEILEYNRVVRRENKANNSNINLRVYQEEKRPLLRKKDIPITFGTTFITYEANEHISYDSVIQCIIDVNIETQKSPVSSENNE